MNVCIRQATASHAEGVARLTNQLGYEVAAADVAPKLGRIAARTDQQFLLAEVDGQPVGWVHAAIGDYVESEAFVVIAGLVVDRNYRRQGIARMLVERVEAWARDQGCDVIRLSSSSTRTGAHRFYEQLGFRNIKTQYAFAKALDAARADGIRRFIPRVDE
jgi:GNAT superfamily N-acetyltransferase